MFKLVVLFALVALAVAAPAPGIIGAPVVHSAVVGSIPTSVSHQSSSIVHSAAVVAPVVHAAPIIHAPIVHHAALAVHPAPLTYAHHGIGYHGLHHGLHHGVVLH